MAWFNLAAKRVSGGTLSKYRNGAAKITADHAIACDWLERSPLMARVYAHGFTCHPAAR